jgi:hypothetical protein
MELTAYEIKHAGILSRIHLKRVHFTVGLPVLSNIYFLQTVDP